MNLSLLVGLKRENLTIAFVSIDFGLILIIRGTVELSCFVMEIAIDIAIGSDIEIGIEFEIDSVWKYFRYFDWSRILVELLLPLVEVRSLTAAFEVVAGID